MTIIYFSSFSGLYYNSAIWSNQFIERWIIWTTAGVMFKAMRLVSSEEKGW